MKRAQQDATESFAKAAAAAARLAREQKILDQYEKRMRTAVKEGEEADTTEEAASKNTELSSLVENGNKNNNGVDLSNITINPILLEELNGIDTPN